MELRQSMRLNSPCPGSSAKRIFALDVPGIHAFTTRGTMDADGRVVLAMTKSNKQETS
jgi:hypothetical protein